jgi:glycosyltransferase A (GT-A) superfamily protein (DUF2064 family)
MSDRAVAVLLDGPPASGGCPPGVDPDTFARALAEDVADQVGDLPGLDAAIAYSPERHADADAVRWPDTRLVSVADRGGPLAALAALAALGYREGAVVAPDAPDVPALMIAKPFSALTTAAVAAAPAEGGGLVVLATRLPAPPWLAAAAVDLDIADALARLRTAAPTPADLAITPGWRRLRHPRDIARLDPDLEGWEATRALLSGFTAR